MQLKKTVEDGKASHVHGSAELILCKILYYFKQSTNWIQYPSKVQCHFLIQIEK
jgi:hypothetical protein